jgi:hypothetical protein
MTDTGHTSPLDAIREKLRAHPELHAEEEPGRIVVAAQGAEGFDVWFFCDGDGYTVGFAGWHETFSAGDVQEALDCFAFGLSGQARLRVHRRGGLDYRWTLESLENGVWHRDSTTCLLFFPFWRRKSVRYLRNWLPASEGA